MTRTHFTRRFAAVSMQLIALCGLLVWGASSRAAPPQAARPQLPYKVDSYKEPLWSKVKFEVTFGVFRAAVQVAEAGDRLADKFRPAVAGAKTAVRRAFPRWDAMKQRAAAPVRAAVGEAALRLVIGIDAACNATNKFVQSARPEAFPSRNDLSRPLVP